MKIHSVAKLEKEIGNFGDGWGLQRLLAWEVRGQTHVKSKTVEHPSKIFCGAGLLLKSVINSSKPGLTVNAIHIFLAWCARTGKWHVQAEAVARRG